MQNVTAQIFNFTCQGESDKSTKLMLKHGKVNRPLAAVCSNTTRGIRMAFNNRIDMDLYNLYNESYMVAYNMHNDYISYNESYSTIYNMVAWNMIYDYNWPGGVYPYEILSSFFTLHNLSPTWQDVNGTSGWFNNKTGLWNGAVALVSSTMLA